MSRPSLRFATLVAALSLAAFPSCRESTPIDSGALLPVVPNAFGANGCTTPDQAFGQAPAQVPLATLQIAALSQVTASPQSNLLFATGADATVVEIDVTDPGAPVERELLAAGDVAALLATFGITDAPVLSAVAVLSAELLVVAEHTANVLLTVNRVTPGTVEHFAGLPSTVPGFADGLATGTMLFLARFSFDQPCQIVPVGDSGGDLFLTDSGNHAVRSVIGAQVSTIAGMGTPFTFDGDLSSAGFDTPSGLTATCANTLIVSELGDYGGGQRLRSLFILSNPTLFGDLDGGVSTLVGDGVDATTQGVSTDAASGALAQVSRPASPLSTTGGAVYWVDSGTGVLRRLAGDQVDCPLAVDCATAVTTPAFTAGGTHSLTQTASGDVYVLDNTAMTLSRIPN